MISSIARFVIEFYRTHQQALPFNGPFSLTQWIALALLVPGTIPGGTAAGASDAAGVTF